MTSRLSSDKLVKMEPLLGSLARLIARGTAISTEELKVLLSGADLEASPDVLDELRRWTDLLQSVYSSPNEHMRRVVVEALKLRGLPEAPVLLAVSTVAEGAPTLVEPSSQPVTSVDSLDFGTLRPGQTARAEFEVWGGPGHIVVESDQVQVRPQEFGAGPIRVQVEVKPLAESLLWTSLKLVTASATKELPVVAWCEEALPDAPPSSNTSVIAPDGSGSIHTLQEAVQQAQPDTAITRPAFGPRGWRRWILATGVIMLMLGYILLISSQGKWSEIINGTQDLSDNPTISLPPSSAATSSSPSISSSSLTPSRSTQEYFWVTAERLNVREGPGISYRVIGELNRGERITVVGYAKDETWAKISAPYSGWVSTNYISRQPPQRASSSSLTPSLTPSRFIQEYFWVTAERLNVREGPGISYRVIGELNRGERITVVGYAKDETWAKISAPYSEHV